MVSFTLSSALTVAIAALAIAAPSRRSLPEGQDVYLALLTTNGSYPLYATHSSAGSLDLVFRPGTYYDGTPAILVNNTNIVFDIGENLPYGLTQPEFVSASGSKVDIPDAVTAVPGVGTSGLRVYSGVLQPAKVTEAAESWVFCQKGDDYTFEFVIEGPAPGSLQGGCQHATVQVYTRI